jgi:hypothetical protein
MLTLHLHVSSLPSTMCLSVLYPQTFMHVRYANVTEKQPCIFELSTYSGINAAGLGFLNTIVRDNCQTARFFCDTTSQLCERLRLVGQQCQYHRECQSVRFRVSPLFFSIFRAESHVQYNCIQNVCADPPEEPFEVALWQYVVTTLAVVLGKVSSLFQDNDLRRPVSKCHSNGNYLHHVSDDAPPASIETL